MIMLGITLWRCLFINFDHMSNIFPLLISYCIFMQEDKILGSLSKPQKKTRQILIFPKISKGEAFPTEKKVFENPTFPKNPQTNIFKVENQKRQKIRLYLEQQRLKQAYNRQLQELSKKIQDLSKHHSQDLQQITQRDLEIGQNLHHFKDEQYELKLSIWQLKNEIITLDSLAVQEEQELNRLESIFHNESFCQDQIIDDPQEIQGEQLGQMNLLEGLEQFQGL